MTEPRIVFDNVSRFYGEVLGVNRVNLSIQPGITSLVGPNGSGKTTLMNLMTGLIRPSRGSIKVLGIPPERPEELFRKMGYCTQFDAFPKGLTGYQFIYSFLLVHGMIESEAAKLTEEALQRVSMTEAADRQVAAYSKGMRQRIKLAQAIAHRRTAHGGAEGQTQGVRSEVKDQPMQILVRCDKPGLLASRLFEQDHVVEAKVNEDGRGLLVRTRDADNLYLLLNRIVLDNGLEGEAVAPADDDVNSVYQYLIGAEGGTT